MSVRLFSPRAAPAAKAPLDAPRSGAGPTHGRLLEAGALLLFAGAVFLFLALASCRVDPRDPGLRGADWAGPAGAIVARILVLAFGVVAWLAPVALTLMALPLLRSRAPRDLGLRVAGDLAVGIVLSALVQVALPGRLGFGQAPIAGNVGLLFGELMRELFSTPGSFLVGPTLIGLILIGRSSFSFIETSQRFLELTARLAARLRALQARLLAAWSEARSRRRVERAAEDATPPIEVPDKDATILMQLEENDPDWMPMEETGPPPVTLSQALQRAAQGLPPEVVLAPKTEPETAPSAPQTAPEPAPAAPEAAADRGKRRRRGTSDEPTIVDTGHERAVERGRERTRSRLRDDFRLPPFDLLEAPEPVESHVDEARLRENSAQLVKTLLDYGVQGTVKAILPGPTVTLYEVSCEAGTKVARVAGLADDLALGLSRKVRIIAPIPGKSRIGFELPNDARIPVSLRELIEDQRFDKLAEKAPLPVVLGRDIVGKPFYADLASMPHVIIAGATGAGKSVGLNVMLSSLLYKRSPQELRLLMIDPKVVELAPFDGIPHMLLPVVTDMKQAATALRWAVDEMERRYQLFADAGTKNVGTYNGWVDKVRSGEVPAPRPEQVEALSGDGAVVSVTADEAGADGKILPGKLPYIVVVVDEFADLMMQQGKDVEASVARLAQKSRAAGMHILLATQRPSVDVITGMIKANFPTRIAYRVAQKVDSRTILDEQGAEHLLGRGDMLVKLNGGSDLYRVQCPFVSEDEVGRLTDYLRSQGSPEYHEAILQAANDGDSGGSADEGVDSRFDEAARIVADTQRCSTSWLQRKMTIGYNRAAKIVETMEKRGMVGPPNGARDREVFLQPL